MGVTSVIFACFSGAALVAPDGKYLYLGGTLLSGLSTLMWLGFLNIFFRSQLLFQAHIWIGLAVFCGFIMFDTQVIIRKARNGDRDFVAHSLDLFIDFFQLCDVRTDKCPKYVLKQTSYQFVSLQFIVKFR